MQVSEHVHVVEIPFTIPVAPGREMKRVVYAYPLLGPRLCCIDTGVTGSAEIICRAVRSAGRDPRDMELCVLTHCHPDHIGGAIGLHEATGCLFAAHGDAVGWTEDVSLQFLSRPVPGFEMLVEGDVTVTRRLADGDRVTLGDGCNLTVLHTPGHSAGHVALWYPSQGVLFSGDAILPPGGMPVYDDALVARRSIRRLAGLDGVEVLLSSFESPIVGASAVAERLASGIAYLERIQSIVRAARDAGETDAAAITKAVVTELGLPGLCVNPITIHSVQSHLDTSDDEWDNDGEA